MACSYPHHPSPFAIKLRLGFSLTGFFVGLSIFFCFGLLYNNWHAAVWGLASAVYAGLTFYSHHEYKRNEWRENSIGFLITLIAVGWMGVVASIIAAPTYIIIGVNNGQALTPDSLYLGSVWAFMTLKWSSALTFYSHSYRALYYLGYEEINDDILRKI